VQLRDKHLGVIAQFGPTAADLYYKWEVKLIDVNQAAKPVVLGYVTGAVWCNYGAIGVERIDFVLLMDYF
jgi:hypothetical protein